MVVGKRNPTIQFDPSALTLDHDQSPNPYHSRGFWDSQRCFDSSNPDQPSSAALCHQYTRVSPDNSCFMKSLNQLSQGFCFLGGNSARLFVPLLTPPFSLLRLLRSYPNERVWEAVDVKRSLSKKGLKADEVTYCTLILGLCRVKDFEAGVKLMDEMIESGFVHAEAAVSGIVEGLRKQ
ncbi:hypothetical protein K1719_018376 [Acacia pycnantha]|nr:hypothetical protein K1719_018376 [Acacia pycnantha]